MSTLVRLAHRAVGAAMASRRWRWHVIAPVLVALGVGALVLGAAGETLRPAPRVSVIPVVFDRSVEGQPTGSNAEAPITPSVQAPGWLEADPYFVACSALADGVVEEILVLEGARVERGDVVARLVDEDAALALQRAEADLAAAKGEFAVAEADLHAAQTDWDHPVERERAVGTSAASLAEAESELQQLPALIEAEQALLDRMNEELTRTKRSFESHAASDIEVIILEKDFQRQAAATEALRLSRSILEARVAKLRAEADASRRAAELRVTERRALDGAKAGLERARAAVMQAEASRDEAALRLGRMVIKAPISGFVQRRLKAPGDKVLVEMDDPHSAHLALLYDPARLQVRVDVPLADASHVRVGQACEVVVEVLPDTVFAGEVTRITHEADIQKNTLQVKVRVVDPLPILRPEMLTRVKFLGSDGGTVDASPGGAAAPVLVDQACLTAQAGDHATVWAVRQRRSGRGVVAPVDVRVVEREGEWITVQGDLRAGDLLATGDSELQAGQRVRLRTARSAGGSR